MATVSTNEKPYRLIRRKQLEQIVGIARSTIYDKLNPDSSNFDPDFPKPIHIGPRMIAWVESEVQDYIDACIKTSRMVQKMEVIHAK